jgi:hypothetical protein
MRRCDDCKIILDDDVRHCPKCGGDVASDAPARRPATSDISSLLASANLHRIRAEWDSAIADATDALRLDPRNPDIPSLLGGIYEDRGMRDEALAWYQMAIEMNPDSVSDQERLDRVSDLILAKSKQGRAESFHTFEWRTKVWALALGAVFVVMVVLAIVSVVRNKPSEAPFTMPIPTAQSQRRTAPLTAPGETLPQRPPAGSEAATPAPASASSVRTPGESYIRSELSTSQAVTETGASIDDVIADPRSGVVSVTFAIPVKVVVTKEQITRAAAAVARKTFDLNREVKFVTVRCVIQVGGIQGTLIAFVGDIARQSIDALGPSAGTDQLAGAFTHPWWNPQAK